MSACMLRLRQYFKPSPLNSSLKVRPVSLAWIAIDNYVGPSVGIIWSYLNEQIRVWAYLNGRCKLSGLNLLFLFAFEELQNLHDSGCLFNICINVIY